MAYITIVTLLSRAALQINVFAALNWSGLTNCRLNALVTSELVHET